MTQRKPTCIIATMMRERGVTGVQTHIAMAAQALRAGGFEVEIVTPFNGRGLFRTPVFALRKLLGVLHKDLDVFWYRFGHYVYLKSSLRQALAEKSHVDVIYAQCPLSAKAARAAMPNGKIPVVMVTHFNGSQAWEWQERGKINKDGWLYRAILRTEAEEIPKADTIVYVSTYMRQVIEERIPAAVRTANVIVPNFIDGCHETNAAKSHDLMSIGTLEPRKNQQFLLEVLAELARRGRKLSLTLAGEGEDLEKLKALAAELGVAPQVRFLGHRTDICSLLPSHRLYVHAATIESFGIVLVEALSAGVPIVAAQTGGVPDVLQDGMNGRFWDIQDPVAGADVLMELVSDGPLLQEMSRQARKDFETHFSMQAAGAKLVSVLRSAAQRLPQRSSR